MSKTRCSSHYERPAIGSFPVRHRNDVGIAVYNVPACEECLDGFNRNQAARSPYTKDWHLAQVDRLASIMRHTIADWFEASRNDETEIRRLYGEMLIASRSLAAELAAIAAINYRESVRKEAAK